jgi:hypothetical protein
MKSYESTSQKEKAEIKQLSSVSSGSPMFDELLPAHQSGSQVWVSEKFPPPCTLLGFKFLGISLYECEYARNQ